MSLSLISTPIKTINGLLTTASAGRSQLPYEFLEDALQEGYKLEIQIWDKQTTTQLVPLTFRYSAESNGRIFIDVGQILTDLQEYNKETSLEYVLRYRPSWIGSDELWVDTDVVQSLYAKKQIGLLGGSSIWRNLLRVNSEAIEGISFIDESSGFIRVNTVYAHSYIVGDIVHVKTRLYNDIGVVTALGISTAMQVNIPYRVSEPLLPNLTIGIIEGLRPLLLTLFKESKIWRGWYRTISFLSDSELFARNNSNLIRIRTRNLDINKDNPITIGGTNYPNVGINPTINTVDLLEGVQLQSSAKYLEAQCTDSSGSVRYSKELFYKIIEDCPHPIMIEWVNSLGGLEQYMFSINQEVEITASKGLAYDTPINKDQEFVNTTKQRVFSGQKQKMLLIAQNLDNENIMALSEIKTSTDVSVYLTKDGLKKVGVIVNDALGTSFDSRGDLQDFRLVIEFPENYNFYTSKYY